MEKKRIYLTKVPLVSVVMSVHNEEKSVGDSIESILNQTFSNFEFIIVNDSSTDNTQKILEFYAKKDKRIELIINKKKLGPFFAANRGIECAKGDYIARMDAGDISHINRFERQIEFLDNNKDIHIVGTWGYWIDENSEIIGKWMHPPFINDVILYKTGAAIHPSIMIRRKLLDEIGLYETYYGADFDLYMRAIKEGFNIANIPNFLISIRMREGITFNINLLKTTHIRQFKTKMKYLPYFLNFWNLYYTIKCLIACLLPSFLLLKKYRSMRSGIFRRLRGL